MIRTRRQDKARILLAAACACQLCGCVSPQKLQKARDDISAYSAARRENDVAQRCVDAGAMPGTEANLECRLGLGKPQQTPPAQ
jgi:outer membrane murein-binding lipoprotein Lpp